MRALNGKIPVETVDTSVGLKALSRVLNLAQQFGCEIRFNGRFATKIEERIISNNGCASTLQVARAIWMSVSSS